jgi:hypothetical protein
MNPELSRMIEETVNKIKKSPEGSTPINTEGLKGNMENIFGKVIQKDKVEGSDAIQMIGEFWQLLEGDNKSGLPQSSVETNTDIIQNVAGIMEESLKSLRLKKQLLQTASDEEKVKLTREFAGEFAQEAAETIARIKMAVREGIQNMAGSAEAKNGTTN